MDNAPPSSAALVSAAPCQTSCRALTLFIAFLVIATHGARSASADTLRVPSEFPTIQAAIDAASSGDVVLVAPGLYEERITVDVPTLMLVSETVGGALVRQSYGVVIVSADSCTLRGFSIESMMFASGNPTLSLNGEGSLVEGCVLSKGKPCVSIYANGTLRGCTISEGRGGIEVLYGADVLLEECSVVSNVTDNVGGGLLVFANLIGPDKSNVTIIDCRFVNNRADVAGGALATDSSFEEPTRLTMERCLLLGNSSSVGAAIYSVATELTLRSCTIVGNSVLKSNSDAGTVDFDDDIPVTSFIDRCIIAFNAGAAVRCYFAAQPTVSCSDVFGNSDDTLCGQDGGDNLGLDPLFCNKNGEDFTLQSASPCAPGQSPGTCGLIGAFPPTCVNAVSETTWGAIKHRHAAPRRF